MFSHFLVTKINEITDSQQAQHQILRISQKIDRIKGGEKYVEGSKNKRHSYYLNFCNNKTFFVSPNLCQLLTALHHSLPSGISCGAPGLDTAPRGDSLSHRHHAATHVSFLDEHSAGEGWGCSKGCYQYCSLKRSQRTDYLTARHTHYSLGRVCFQCVNSCSLRHRTDRPPRRATLSLVSLVWWPSVCKFKYTKARNWPSTVGSLTSLSDVFAFIVYYKIIDRELTTSQCDKLVYLTCLPSVYKFMFTMAKNWPPHTRISHILDCK